MPWDAHPFLPAPPRLCPQQQEKVRWEEQRRSMQQDAQQKAQLAQYQVSPLLGWCRQCWWHVGCAGGGAAGGSGPLGLAAGCTTSSCTRAAMELAIKPTTRHTSEPYCRAQLSWCEQDELARKRLDVEHDKQRQRQVRLTALL